MSNNWMQCTTCKAIVELNATGICLGCQGGFNPFNEEDKYNSDAKTSQQKDDTKMRQEEVSKLKDREKELEDAIQKSSSEKVYVQSKAKISKRVRNCNTKRKEITKEVKEEEKED